MLHVVWAGVRGGRRDSFDEMGASYVLRYSPRGVEPGGWHTIRVEVVGNDDLDIRARRGNFGG